LGHQILLLRQKPPLLQIGTRRACVFCVLVQSHPRYGGWAGPPSGGPVLVWSRWSEPRPVTSMNSDPVEVV